MKNKKVKLNLEQLKVKSFQTNLILEKQDLIKAGGHRQSKAGWPACAL